ncbi:UNVERIFIED_CONTAM: PilZ domain-containing protein [Acetivibrio alkalicellulosi]
MNFVNPGDVVTIRHYSGINPFRSIVISITENIIKIKLTGDFAVFNFFEGDPIVFGIEKSGETHMVGCNIVTIDNKAGSIDLRIDKTERDADLRRHERFPVSLYSDIRTRYAKKKHLGIIKDISFFGMLIYSKSDFEIGDNIEIDIYMEKKVLFLKGDIVRKTQEEKYIQYGIRITYEDANAMNFMKDYLRKQKELQEDSLKNSLT